MRLVVCKKVFIASIISLVFWPYLFWKYNGINLLCLGLIASILIIGTSFYCFKKGKLKSFILVLGVLFLGIFFGGKNRIDRLTILGRNELDWHYLNTKRSLYDNRIEALLLQNKYVEVIDKYNKNLFLLIDPNNYFFGLHPRELVGDNQNLMKFPFLAIIPFFVGVINIKKYKNRTWWVALSSSLIILLALLKNPDRYDFVLWFPLGLMIIYGLGIMARFKQARLLFGFYLIFCLMELIRVI